MKRSRRAILLLVAGTAAGAVLAYAVVVSLPSSFVASATLVPQSRDPTQPLFDPATSSGSVRRLLRTNARLLNIRSVSDLAAGNLPAGVTQAEADRAVEGRVPADRDLLVVEAVGEDREQSAQLANAYADALVSYRTATEQSNLSREARTIDQLLDDGVGPVAARAALTQRLLALRALAENFTSSLTVVEEAEPRLAERRWSPVAGAAAGGGLGTGIAVLVLAGGRRRRRVELTEPVASAELSTTVRGTVPESRAIRRARAMDDLPLDDSAAFDRLADELASSKAGGSRVILITSPHRFDGRTTIAWRLARSYSARGRRTLLVEADMQNPRLQEWIPEASGPGLCAALSGSASLGDSVVEPPDETEDSRLPSVLPAGQRVSRAEYLVDSPSMADLLRQARDQYDVVIVDGPAGFVGARIGEALDSLAVVVRIAGRQQGSLAGAERLTGSLDSRTGVVLNATHRPG